MSKPTLNFRYLVYGIFSVASGVLVSIFGGRFFAGNDDATQVIVTVFSILAGFLIAVMSLLGDQSILPGSWRISVASKAKIQTKLVRHKWLFYLYLLTLAVIFLSTLISKELPVWNCYLEKIYFGLATTAFLLSFRLPSSLMSVQMDRIDAVIGMRKKDTSKLDRS